MAPDDGVKLRILVVDDEHDIRETLQTFFGDRGHFVETAPDGMQALERLKRSSVDVVLTDIRMPGMGGLDLLDKIKTSWPGTEVIVITAFDGVENAVSAIKRGAFDFFQKPIRPQDLLASLQRTMRYHTLKTQLARVEEQLELVEAEVRREYGADAIVGQSEEMAQLRRQIVRICRSRDVTVLISGETGTGKELAARAIHTESGRRNGPFVAVNCSAIPETLFESEFYGHERGAFTDAKMARKGHFEMADGGTLFLDEVGDMPPSTQGKLLRTIEERAVQRLGRTDPIQVDLRVVAATNKDLRAMVAAGRFREDLYYRLNGISLPIPTLRDRRADVAPLAVHFLRKYSGELRKPLRGFTSGALRALEAHSFPGNVRELRNAVERAVIFADGDQVDLADLQLEQSLSRFVASAEDTAGWVARLPDEAMGLELVEKDLIAEALKRTRGNQVRAAALLGVTRDTLRRRIDRFGLR